MHIRGPEAQVLHNCLALLRHLGIPAWRSNSGGVTGSYTSKRTGKTKSRFIKFAGIDGLSDITGLVPTVRRKCQPTRDEESGDQESSYITMKGVFIAIECKSPGNDVTAKQGLYLKMVAVAGGIALVVHSADELERDLVAEGVVFTNR